MWNFSGSSPITGWTFLAMGLYFFLADKKRSVYGTTQSEGEVVEGEVVEGEVVEGEVVEGEVVEGEVVESAGVWKVLYKVDNRVSGKSQADK
jgi:hypothetical protein